MKTDFFENYASRLQAVIAEYQWEPVSQLALPLRKAGEEKRSTFFCGGGEVLGMQYT